MAAGPTEAAAPAPLRPLLVELNDLKRVRSAGRRGSIAERLFAQSWGALCGGAEAEGVALQVTATALAAARLGDLDAVFLAALGLAPGEAGEVLGRAFDEVARDLDPALRDALRRALLGAEEVPAGPLPGFVGLLAAQPRAGVTCPGRPRIVLEPPENHAEHCLMVAIYGVVLSPFYGADPATVFVAALAHHLHNALMPDSGFTGEVLLGPHLDGVIARSSAHALEELEPGLRARVERARRILPDDGTAEGRAFHAADVIDRVLQIAQHLRAASLGMDDVLGEMALVHEGPVKGFHDRVLAAMRLP
ncbi:conserved hypothetical protein [Methylobacterium sp. 4-46]|uniref:hypothetical protein n=1 Tax=unclassified Methylobacterium TaxID=2615210 RepID=UPI000165C5E8|nr:MULTISPECIES: hypothetical protein [Methylobacterium]ACA16750.1 conserved hypothetical protein [Methylobacterium sp. 4-46]WFT82446.1 hypothetical protein QA634_11605 [Methylobacterium nodulans]